MGHTGLLVGLVLALAAKPFLSLRVTGAASALSYVRSHTLARGAKAIRGQKRLVSYHELVVVGGCTALLAWLGAMCVLTELPVELPAAGASDVSRFDPPDPPRPASRVVGRLLREGRGVYHFLVDGRRLRPGEYLEDCPCDRGRLPLRHKGA